MVVFNRRTTYEISVNFARLNKRLNPALACHLGFTADSWTIGSRQAEAPTMNRRNDAGSHNPPNTRTSSSTTVAQGQMIARGSFVLLLLLISGAVLPLVICGASSSSARLYHDDTSTTTTTLAAAAADFPAAIAEQRQHPRLLLRRSSGGGNGKDTATGAAEEKTEDPEHRRRRLRTNKTARRMQEYVYNSSTGRYEPETKTKSYKLILLMIPVVLALLLFLCYCQQQELRQKGAPVSAAPRIIPKPGLVLPPSPRLVTAAATKFAPQTRCGVAFVGTDFAQITRIDSDSIFAGTELEPGMKIVFINNIAIHSTQQALATLRAAPDVVTIVAHSAGYYGSTENLVTATIVKDRQDQPMGISYKRDDGHGPIRLGMFPATSLLSRSSSNPSSSSSDVTPGMEVVTINNIPVLWPFSPCLCRRKAAWWWWWRKPNRSHRTP
jgi:hypothetical protein